MSIDWADPAADFEQADPATVRDILRTILAGHRHLKGSRLDRVVAAFVLVRDHGYTAGQLVYRLRITQPFNHRIVALVKEHPDAVALRSAQCAQCGNRPRRVGRWCTWCWDKNERTEKADGAGQTPGSEPTPSNS
jgi:hypothetical protein